MSRTRTTAIKQQQSAGWLAYLDVYGFSAEVRDKPLRAVVKRLRSLQRDIANTVPSKHAAQYIFSDSILIFWPTAPGERPTVATAAIDTLKTIQKRAQGNDFILRGALVYGTMNIGPGYFVGEPLIRAVRLEQALAIPIVVIPDIELNPQERSLSAPYQIENIPMKVGLMRAYPILPTPRRELHDWIAKKALKHLREGPFDVAQTWDRLHQFIENMPLPKAGAVAGANS